MAECIIFTIVLQSAALLVMWLGLAWHSSVGSFKLEFKVTPLFKHQNCRGDDIHSGKYGSLYLMECESPAI
jgi:hypothetical protein